jgi:hypothetical protein
MGPRDIRNGKLHVKQAKTSAELRIPVLPQLQEIIAASPVGLTTFLVDELGKPYKRRTSRRLAWPVHAAISCSLHPASANSRAAALRSPCALQWPTRLRHTIRGTAFRSSCASRWRRHKSL